MAGWGFLWSVAGRHLLVPRQWPRHRTYRYEAPHDPHYIHVSQIARCAAGKHNAPAAVASVVGHACLVGRQVGLCDVVCVIQAFHNRHCQVA